MKHRKFKPYIRRMTGKEKAKDFRTAFRLAFYQEQRSAYVMVQHGFPNIAILVGKTKRDVKNQILVVGLKKKTFNQWARNLKRTAQGRK